MVSSKATHAYTHACTHACMVQTCLHRVNSKATHARTRAYSHACTHAYTHDYKHVYTHVDDRYMTYDQWKAFSFKGKFRPMMVSHICVDCLHLHAKLEPAHTEG